MRIYCGAKKAFLVLEFVENPKTEISEVYVIPENTGAVLVESEGVEGILMSQYSLGEEKLTLTQSLPTILWNVNTENKTVEPIEINGRKGYYIQMDNECYLSWTMDGYIFDICGNSEKKQLLISKTDKSEK